MEWNEAGRVHCGIQCGLIKMQCFQQLLASSVLPGFLFHTLLSCFLLAFSLASCLVFTFCGFLRPFSPVLCSPCFKPCGFWKASKPVGAGVCLNPSFLGCSTCQLPGAMLKVRLRTEEQLPHWASKSKLPLSLGMESVVSFSCSCRIFCSRILVFFPDSSPGRFPNLNCS